MFNARTFSVVAMAFASGLPLGLVWISIPDWMRGAGVDIRIVGLTTLAHAPWTFKILWAPLMDRFAIPWLGRRRGWIAVCQLALFAMTLVLAGAGADPDTPFVVISIALALAFVSASHDVVYDAYTVDVLRKEEQGVAVGAKISVYRLGMQLAGAISISLTAWLSWPLVVALQALLYLPVLFVTLRAPEPEADAERTPLTLRAAVWEPFLGFLTRHRALEILAFVLFYKLADNLSQSLLRPFLIDMGYNEFDRGLALLSVGLAGTLIGTFLGGWMTSVIGLGHSLWLFGFLQIFSNVGYLLIIWSDTSRATMIGAMGFETFTTGLGMGAFGTLLVRLTEKRFSATQYALFSSLFALPRIVAGPITGVMVYSVGWQTFFVFTMVAGIPGLVLLQRFSPLGLREPRFGVEEPRRREPLGPGRLALRGVFGGVLGLLGATTCVALLQALDGWGKPEHRFSPWSRAVEILIPADSKAWFTLLGLVVFAAACGLFTAAVIAARRGARVDDGA